VTWGLVPGPAALPVTLVPLEGCVAALCGWLVVRAEDVQALRLLCAVPW
jgi:hypothetical protein